MKVLTAGGDPVALDISHVGGRGCQGGLKPASQALSKRQSETMQIPPSPPAVYAPETICGLPKARLLTAKQVDQILTAPVTRKTRRAKPRTERLSWTTGPFLMQLSISSYLRPRESGTVDLDFNDVEECRPSPIKQDGDSDFRLLGHEGTQRRAICINLKWHGLGASFYKAQNAFGATVRVRKEEARQNAIFLGNADWDSSQLWSARGFDSISAPSILAVPTSDFTKQSNLVAYVLIAPRPDKLIKYTDFESPSLESLYDGMTEATFLHADVKCLQIFDAETKRKVVDIDFPQ